MTKTTTSLRDTNATEKAIAAILDALHARLDAAALLVEEAHAAMEEHEQNQAIGTILRLERLLPVANALFRAALALHEGG